MRCIWSTTARNAFHTLAVRGAALSYGRAGISRVAYRPSSYAHQLRFPTTMRVSATSAALSYSRAVAADSISLEEAVDTVPESSTSLPNLLTKPSKISFAAAQAIRMCMGNDGIADGFFILNSIRYAAHRHSSSALPFKMPGMLHSKVEFEAAALQFGPDVSQRLPAHSLLHGLVRKGMAQPAFDLAKMMMAEGVVIRSKTLELVIRALVRRRRPKIPGLSFATPRSTIPLEPASDVLCLRPSTMATQRTRLALKLLFLARRHRQRRTDTMFKLFMAASLLNGELIIFSLLFGWTCREWQTTHSLGSNLEVIPDDDGVQASGQVIAARDRWAQLCSERIFPDRETLHEGLSVIDTTLGARKHHSRLVALQALGNLAGLLDRRQIPFPDIAPLLRTMYNCPRVKDEIWIVGDGGCPERIKAYEYFHRVILNLIQSLPDPQSDLPPPSVHAITTSQRYDMLPPLDLHGYNTLLHYALRHRLSPELAQGILSHMKNNGYRPDTTTANILMRSGTLLRRYDIVKDVLLAMGNPTFLPFPSVPRKSPVLGDQPAIPETGVILPSSKFALPRRTETEEHHTRLGAELHRMGREKIRIPELPSRADVYTLNSYISYLTAIGRWDALRDLLFEVIPELKDPLYTTLAVQKEDRPQLRLVLLAALRRAIALGPAFFAAILNGLYKAKKYVLADRVWQLAKKAEEFSWLRHHVPECEPWIFGPQVYTIMLNCYGVLARLRRDIVIKLRPGQRFSMRTARERVWARFLHECSKLPSPPRLRQVQQTLHRVMGNAALDVFRRLISLRHEYRFLPQLNRWLAPKDIPGPDARFFNAALRVFRPPADTMRRSWYRKKLRGAQHILDRHGVVPASKGWNPSLQEVAEEMIQVRYPIPIGLQHLFVGRLQGMELPAVERPVRGPYVFGEFREDGDRREGEPRNLSLFRLRTPKERGLPVTGIYTQFERLRDRHWDRMRGRQLQKKALRRRRRERAEVKTTTAEDELEAVGMWTPWVR
ncbi:hypothetical protein DFH07DRAFT_917408 [Mycena maculata]|uniref:Pentatricopeptide repeat domain-containing protein n=1 Tax=Mycena maculata TaxID=230809 RepID=A0AAD7JFN6_9AGAR|nr:hypothetical protein DFH07DRAFT_917408 [Mycena maculata]